ncbi:MAG: toxin-antitoxin system HicB family antitoxin [Nitrospinae bacterium]|nr:toxin-antitoxin system HicB family antitoxin [Nitrospinota bacterium]
MAILTIRMPDDKRERLRRLAHNRRISVNKLMEELATIALTEYDIETRFRALAATGNVKEGLKILDKLEKSSGKR